MDTIEFNKDDVVLDCGANCADLYLYFSDYYPFIKYESFEPSPREFECLQKNVLDGYTNHVGLHDKIGKFEFYVSSIGADSSFIKPKNYTDIIEVNIVNNGVFQSNLSCLLLNKYISLEEPTKLKAVCSKNSSKKTPDPVRPKKSTKNQNTTKI